MIERKIKDEDFYEDGPRFVREVAHETVVIFAAPVINLLAERINRLEALVTERGASEAVKMDAKP